MDEAYRPGGILEKAPTKPVKDPSAPALKREDIDIIVRCCFRVFLVVHKMYTGSATQVHEFEIPRVQAEKALAENGGDLEKTLRSLITP
jgi:hypothetical protein